MVILPHTAVGSLIGLCIGKLFKKKTSTDQVHYFWPAYVLTCIFCILSHFALDAIPHTEYVTPEKFVLHMRILADALAAGGSIWAASWGFCDGVFRGCWERRLLFCGSCASIAPDILAYMKTEFHIRNVFLKAFYEFHAGMHTQVTIGYWPGVGTQCIVVVVSLAIICVIVARYDI